MLCFSKEGTLLTSSTLRVENPSPLFSASAHHRIKNLHVASAAAEISRQPIANVRFSRIRISFQQIDGRQYHTRRADAALRAAAVDEGLLHSVQLIAGRNAFDSLNGCAFNLCNWNQTTVDDPAIDNDVARATLTFAATFLCPREMQLLTQHVEQTRHRMGFERSRLAVDGALYGFYRVTR
jgi:hypothetical protein